MVYNTYKKHQHSKNVRWQLLLVVTIVGLTSLSACTNRSGKSEPTQKSISYDRFIERVKKGQIERVGLSVDRTQAIAHAKDGTQTLVNLINDRKLIDTIERHIKGDIYILPVNFGNN